MLSDENTCIDNLDEFNVMEMLGGEVSTILYLASVSLYKKKNSVNYHHSRGRVKDCCVKRN